MDVRADSGPRRGPDPLSLCLPSSARGSGPRLSGGRWKRKQRKLEQDVSTAAAAQARGREIAARIEVLESLRARSETDLRIIREISQQLPDTAWLSQLEICVMRVFELYGEAAAAAPLLAIVDGTRTLENAAFMTSLIKTDKGERFQITARRTLAAAGAGCPSRGPVDWFAGSRVRRLSRAGSLDGSRRRGGPLMALEIQSRDRRALMPF